MFPSLVFKFWLVFVFLIQNWRLLYCWAISPFFTINGMNHHYFCRWFLISKWLIIWKLLTVTFFGCGVRYQTRDGELISQTKINWRHAWSVIWNCTWKWSFWALLGNLLTFSCILFFRILNLDVKFVTLIK